MLLAIDIGNTNTVFGLYDGDRLLADWRMETHHHRTPDEWAASIITLMQHRGYSFKDVEAVVCGSVVPPVTGAIGRMVQDYLNTEMLRVEPGTKTGVKVCVDNPREVGADRIVNTLAAHRQYGGPAIVIDFGTATTFDIVSPVGEYMGGAIAPGLGIAADALFKYTAQLRRIELVPPRHPIGKNTVQAMQSGVVLGYIALAEGMIARLKEEMGDTGTAIKVIGTGGLAPLIAAHTDCIDIVDPNLTLDGLRMIYDLNREG
jgi:type III pantothenate kinase